MNEAEKKSAVLAAIVFVAAVGFAGSPFLTTGFAGFSSDQFPYPQENPPVQPAGYAFSIWGVIYLWLIVGAGIGLVRAYDDPDWQAMRTPLTISLTIGYFWIAAAVTSPILATGMIIFMAATAIMAMLRTGKQQPWLQAGPIGLYAGWLTAATGVGIGVTLGGYGILSGQMAAIICLIVVLIVAYAVQSVRPKIWTYPAAVIWALIGVIVANFAAMNLSVIGLAVVGILILGVIALKAQLNGGNS